MVKNMGGLKIFNPSKVYIILRIHVFRIIQSSDRRVLERYCLLLEAVFLVAAICFSDKFETTLPNQNSRN